MQHPSFAKMAFALLFVLTFFSQNLIAQLNSYQLEGVWNYSQKIQEGKTVVEKKFHFYIDDQLIYVPNGETKTACRTPWNAYRIEEDKIVFFNTKKYSDCDCSALNPQQINGFEANIRYDYTYQEDKLTITDGEKTLKLTKHKQETPKELIGSWSYKLNVYSNEDKSLEETDFSIYIGEDRLSQGGTPMECNSCWKDFVVLDNQIIFTARTSSRICTEKRCRDYGVYDTRRADNKGKLLDLFHDMTFELKGDLLILSNGKEKLTLNRIQG